MPLSQRWNLYYNEIKVGWPENLRCQGVAYGEGSDQIFLILCFFLIKEKENKSKFL
jgi:hypothetical protein